MNFKFIKQMSLVFYIRTRRCAKSNMVVKFVFIAQYVFLPVNVVQKELIENGPWILNLLPNSAEKTHKILVNNSIFTMLSVFDKHVKQRSDEHSKSPGFFYHPLQLSSSTPSFLPSSFWEIYIRLYHVGFIWRKIITVHFIRVKYCAEFFGPFMAWKYMKWY